MGYVVEGRTGTVVWRPISRMKPRFARGNRLLCIDSCAGQGERIAGSIPKCPIGSLRQGGERPNGASKTEADQGTDVGEPWRCWMPSGSVFPWSSGSTCCSPAAGLAAMLTRPVRFSVHFSRFQGGLSSLIGLRLGRFSNSCCIRESWKMILKPMVTTWSC